MAESQSQLLRLKGDGHLADWAEQELEETWRGRGFQESCMCASIPPKQSGSQYHEYEGHRFPLILDQVKLRVQCEGGPSLRILEEYVAVAFFLDNFLFAVCHLALPILALIEYDSSSAGDYELLQLYCPEHAACGCPTCCPYAYHSHHYLGGLLRPQIQMHG